MARPRTLAAKIKPSRNNGDALAAAKAAQLYRERQMTKGFVPFQMWVPAHMRDELRDMIHRAIEERLALEEASSVGSGYDQSEEVPSRSADLARGRLGRVRAK